METQKTVVVVTPEGDPFSHRIIKHIERFAKIIFYTRVTLSDEMIASIEPEAAATMSQKHIAIWEQLFEKEVLVLVIKGQAAIRIVLSEIGNEPNPNNCGLESINYSLQHETGLKPTNHLLEDSTFFHRRFAYCSENEERAEHQLKVFLNGSYEAISKF